MQVRKFILLSIVSGLLLTGCQAITQPFGFQKSPQPAPLGTPRPAPTVSEPVQGPILLYEAMARAIQRNLEGEVNRMTTALNRADAASGNYETIVDLARSAGYGSGESSRVIRGDSEIPSNPMGSGGMDRRTDIAVIWDALDFSLLHAATREGVQPVSERRGARRKAIRNILQETRTRYYRAVGAQTLASEIARLLDQARESLRVAREIQRQSPAAASRESLENQRELIETIRGLRAWGRELSAAKIDLAEWMGVPPGSDFQLVEPAWNQPRIPSFRQSSAALEHLALVHRWEADGTGAYGDIGVFRTREAMARLRPGLQFDALDQGGDPWESGRDWRELGMRLIPSMMTPFSGKSDSGARGEAAGYSRRLAVNAAILTQVHLSLQRFSRALEDYRLSYLLDDVNAQLGTGVGGGAATGKDGLSLLLRSRDLLQARMRHYLAFIELENAAFRIYNSLGVDPLPPVEDAVGATAMARHLERSLNSWGNSLAGAQSAVLPETGVSSEDARAMERETPAPSRSPEPAPPSATRPASEPFEQGTPVIDAAAAERKGRRPVKEVEVYRDVVNIHFAPASNSQVKGQGMIGETYRLAGWTPDGWLKIEMMDGSFGWIPTRYVKPVEESESERLGNERAGAEDASSPRKLIVTATRSNVRSGPGLEFDAKYVEAAGVRHIVRETKGEWFRILARDGSEGWLHQSVVKVLTGE